jgi:prepilin-type N-terminal cleavage/methylation domain-containing protein
MRTSTLAPHRQNTANKGFTLFEMLIVIVIAGILALIAAPGWLTFANNRRADAGRDQVLQILRQAQTRALQTRRAQVVDFVTPANALPVIKTAGVEQPLDGQTTSAQRSNSSYSLDIINNRNAGCSTGVDKCVVFDDRGNIKTADNGEPPAEESGIMKIVVSSPANNGSKRCVIVRTLLGAMQNGSGDECNS